jgi:hypothetical protein
VPRTCLILHHYRKVVYFVIAALAATYERNIRDQFARVLSEGGLDPARDIAAITVNRRPHRYAYAYNPLRDPDWPEGKRPCDIARRQCDDALHAPGCAEAHLGESSGAQSNANPSGKSLTTNS